MVKSLKNDTYRVMIDKLTLEKTALVETVGKLKAVNAEQLKRLINAELLRDRIRELEKQIADKKGQ